MDDIYPILEVLEHPGKKVLATIIRVQGSAYKREGSSMLFLENGKQIGMLTAGCVETDLAVKAEEIFKKQEAKVLHYNISAEDDLNWGQGAGCNGTIDILLEPVTDKMKEDFKIVKRSLDSSKAVIVLKKLEQLGEYLFIEDEGGPLGNWSGSIPKITYTSKSGIIPGPDTVYQHTFQPKPRLVVFGAGPDAKPLVALAAKTGFSVTVCDWREGFCQKKYFPNADQLLLGYPKKLLNQISFSPYDFVIIMSHHFDKDQELLKALRKEQIKYLGVLGPRERTKRLLNLENIPSWIYSPVGMNIGAKGHEEIAVSIVAQLIEVWRKPVHERVQLLWTIPD